MRPSTLPVFVAVSLCSPGSSAAQSVPERLAAVEARLAALEAAQVDATVACGSGESLGGVLAQHRGRSAVLRIQLVGMCTESVTIFRNDVILVADGPGNGVQAPPGASHAIQAVGASISLVGLTLIADNTALDVRRGASVTVRNLTINAGRAGIQIQDATVDALNTTIEQTIASPSPGAFGISVSGGSAIVNGTTVRNFRSATGGQCGICATGGTLTVRNSTIEGNSTGIKLTGAHANLFATQVRNSEGTGIDVQASSSLAVTDGAIAGNGSNAVLMMASHASFAGLTTPMLIEGNNGPGVRARLNSVVRLGPSVTIRTNGGGMQLSDGSIVVTDDQGASVQITGNQRGVICLGSQSGQLAGHISDFGGTYHLNATNVFGNGPLGSNISCPGINVP